MLLDALENVVDNSVPLAVRESIIATAQVTPIDRTVVDAFDVKVDSTVQKVGEITRNNGDIENVYVAVTAATVKQDWQASPQHGIIAWALVYWIDNLGPDNELVAAAARWERNDKVLSNKIVQYGTSDIFFLTWWDGPTNRYPSDSADIVYYEDSSYRGFTLRCRCSVTVDGRYTVTANVGSRFVT